jgi:hypothetical protein
MAEPEDRVIRVKRKDLRDALVVINAFVALVCWWIGVSGYTYVGGFSSGGQGFITFLLIPLLLTAATYLTTRHPRRPAHRAHQGRHQSDK